MDRAVDFVKMTLLGLIVGLLIVLLLRLDYLIQDLSQSITETSSYEIREYNEELKPKSDIPPSEKGKKYLELEKHNTVIL